MRGQRLSALRFGRRLHIGGYGKREECAKCVEIAPFSIDLEQLAGKKPLALGMLKNRHAFAGNPNLRIT